MKEVDEQKVKEWVASLYELTYGRVDYDTSLAEFEGQYSKAGVHPNCLHNTKGNDGNNDPWKNSSGWNPFCGGEFRCARCRRLVGWCFGCTSDDGCDGLCDDCTVEIWHKVG